MKQSGFTLLEMMVILALGSIITMGALLTIHQVLTNTDRNNSQVVVLDDINRVILQIKKDIQSYQTANLTDLQSEPTSFAWVNQSGFETGDDKNHYAVYTLTGTVLSHESDNFTAILGRYIESLSFTENGDYVDVEITAISSNVPKRSETLTFSVLKRSEDVGE
jgi:prepilin-type N-terminal cleavage/methylation domain-containing protein